MNAFLTWLMAAGTLISMCVLVILLEFLIDEIFYVGE